VVLDQDHLVDYTNISLTENTRGAYPIQFIQNAKIPCVAGHPSNVIFLTCGAFGVLPPGSSLSPAQAMYHFISGYTAKVAGTEVGVKEPTATFSCCFGGPFMVWHPNKYAQLLAAKMKQHGARVWLVNTGWSGGAYGTGKRIKLANTRDRRCHPQWGTSQGENPARSGVWLRCGDRMPKRARRNSNSPQCLGRQGGL